MNARIVRVRDLTTEDEQAWRALAAEAAEPNPFYEPDCLIPAARHQRFGHEIEVAFAEEDGRFFACIPVRRVRRWRHVPYPFVLTQVRRMVYCGTPLVAPERGDEAMAAIFTALRDRRGMMNGRVLVLHELAADGAAARAAQAGARMAGLPLYHDEPWERGVVVRRDDGDYLGMQNGRFRKNVRRCRRRLGETLGEEPVVVDRSADPVAVDEYLALEAAGYKGNTRVATATVPGEPEYFREMCLRYAGQGRLRVLALEAGGKTVAMNLAVRGGEGIFGMKTSYDERFANFAPGILLHLASMDAFHHGTDAQWIDTCTTPEFEVLLKLYPDRKRHLSYFVPLSRNPVDRIVVRVFIALQPWHQRLYNGVLTRGTGRSSAKQEGPPSDDVDADPAPPAGISTSTSPLPHP